MLKIERCVNFSKTIGDKVVFLLSKIERYGSICYRAKVLKKQRESKEKSVFIFRNVFAYTLLD